MHWSCPGTSVGGNVFAPFVYKVMFGISTFHRIRTLTALGVTISSPVPPLESRLHYNWMDLLTTPPRQLAEDSPPRVTELSQRLSKVHCNRFYYTFVVDEWGITEEKSLCEWAQFWGNTRCTLYKWRVGGLSFREVGVTSVSSDECTPHIDQHYLHVQMYNT